MIQDKILAIQVLASIYIDRVRKSEVGQASAEYAGIIFVAVALVMVLVAATNGWGTAISQKITEAINKIGSGSGS